MRRMIPIVFVHGGGLDSRCWDPTRELLSAPSIAVDLPGRGAHAADLRSVTFADCAESVLADVDQFVAEANGCRIVDSVTSYF
jgi:pimeloyl-ACP methyl ester carboxylesterase